jgi:hypothetical protein
VKVLVSGELSDYPLDLPDDTEEAVKVLATLGRFTLLPPGHEPEVLYEPDGDPDLWTVFIQNDYD